MFHFVPFVGFTTTKQNGVSTYLNFPHAPKNEVIYRLQMSIGLDLDWTGYGL